MSTAALSKPGTLVHARGREWVVLPDSTDELLMVRPVGGLDEEVTGILPAVEPVESATFRLPTADDLGDFASGQLAARCRPPLDPRRRRPVPQLRPHRRRAAALSARAADDGAQARPGAAAHRRRCRHRQDDRGVR